MAKTSRDGAPVDIATMRQTIALLLPHETAEPPTGEELATLTATLPGHIELAVQEVEQLAARLPEDDIPRYCARACIGEARRKLSARPGPGPHDQLPHARKLARSLLALCDHYEALTAPAVAPAS